MMKSDIGIKKKQNLIRSVKIDDSCRTDKIKNANNFEKLLSYLYMSKFT